MSTIRESYEDRDVTFYLQAYRDMDQVEKCLASIRRHYLNSRIILISDGDDDRILRRLSFQWQCELTIGQRLYLVENGGRMIQRMLDAFLEFPTHCLVKVDTDTRVHRRFRYLPAGRAVCGTLEWLTARYLDRWYFRAESFSPNMVSVGRNGCPKSAVGLSRLDAKFLSTLGAVPKQIFLAGQAADLHRLT